MGCVTSGNLLRCCLEALQKKLVRILDHIDDMTRRIGDIVSMRR